VVSLIAILAGHRPYDRSAFLRQVLPPSTDHLMAPIDCRGTCSRVICSARISLFVGRVGRRAWPWAGSSARRRRVRSRVVCFLMRIVDVFPTIPGVLLAIAVVVWLDRPDPDRPRWR
jgi:ABC-type dipeptide/oligopeptide/nickel transport system permease subunit